MACWEAFPSSLTYNRTITGTNRLSEQMALSESKRMTYLKLMGVQPYFPRRPLPGARPARLYAERFLRQSLSSESVPHSGPASAQDVLNLSVAKPPSEPAVHAGALVPQSSRDSVPQAHTEARAPQSSKLPSAQELSTHEREPALEQAEIRFVFAYFPINEHFAVINELPWSKTASVSASCRKLLSDILKALGVEVPERNLNPMVFTWPLFEGAPADLDSENARQTLEGFVAKRLRLLPVKTVIVLAEQAAQLLFPRNFLDAQGSHMKHPRHEVEVVLTHSLNAMEAVPDLKRDVWKTLQPLRGRLVGSSGDPQGNVS